MGPLTPATAPGCRSLVSSAALSDRSSCCRWSVLSRQYLRSSTAGRESGKSAGWDGPGSSHPCERKQAHGESRTARAKQAGQGRRPKTSPALASGRNTRRTFTNTPPTGLAQVHPGVCWGRAAETSDDAEELLDAQASVDAVEKPLHVAAPPAQGTAGFRGHRPGWTVLQEHLAKPANHPLDPLQREHRRGLGRAQAVRGRTHFNLGTSSSSWQCRTQPSGAQIAASPQSRDEDGSNPRGLLCRHPTRHPATLGAPLWRSARWGMLGQLALA